MALPKLSRVLASPWQRVALGIDALIRGGHLEPGRWVTTLGVNALLTDRTNTFDDLPGVYTRTFVGDVLDALAPPDSRSRRRVNHIISRLPSVRYRSRDLLPGGPALARDTAARTELRRLGSRAGVNPLVADTVQLRGNGQVELDPEAVRRAMGTWKAQQGPEPQPTAEAVNRVEPAPAPVGEVEAHAHTPLALPPAPAPEPAPVSVVVVVETQPTPEPEPMLISPGAQLDAIIASGRYPDPRDPAEHEAHMERVRRRIAGIL